MNLLPYQEFHGKLYLSSQQKDLMLNLVIITSFSIKIDKMIRFNLFEMSFICQVISWTMIYVCVCHQNFLFMTWKINTCTKYSLFSGISHIVEILQHLSLLFAFSRLKFLYCMKIRYSCIWYRFSFSTSGLWYFSTWVK